jgi:DNA-binding transcriptional regulator YhcF (GntR family)
VSEVIAHRPQSPLSLSLPNNLERENGILLKPIRRFRLYENAVEQIQTSILRKKCRLGDRLPSERSLAEQSHISRHSLGEARKILKMGMVDLALKTKVPGKAVEAMRQHRLEEEKALAAALEKGKELLRSFRSLAMNTCSLLEKRGRFGVLIKTQGGKHYGKGSIIYRSTP